MRARIVLLILVAVGLSPSLQAQSIADVIRWQATKDAPEQPITPVPASGAIGVSLTPTLTWTSAGATQGYDVYLGVSTTPPKVASVSTPSYTSIALTANTKYYWKVIAKNPKGTITGAVWSFTTLGGLPPPPPPPPPPPDGFAASYWNTTTPGVIPTTAPTLTRTDPAINFDWGAGSPDPSIHVDGFAARWTKTETFAAGTYLFTVTADDGVRLYVDGTLLIDQWIDQGATTYTATRVLTAGSHVIRLDYYEDGGDASAKLTYALQAAMTGVAWDAEPTAAGYVLVYGTSPGVYSTVADVGNVLTYQPSNLQRGVTYFVAVQSYAIATDGSKRYGAFSPEVSGTP